MCGGIPRSGCFCRPGESWACGEVDVPHVPTVARADLEHLRGPFSGSGRDLCRLGVVQDGPPLWFVVLWLLALVWNAYWFLVRIAYRLDLSDTELL
jgi:hypothetical protein